jgi:4-hydroxy-tetrahydrodipicolinate synthase
LKLNIDQGMLESNQSSRRQFLEKLAAGALGLAAASDIYAQPGTVPRLVGNLTSAPPFREKRLVPVMMTGFKPDLKIDFDMVSRITDFYLAAGAKGLFANCLSSEMYFLDDAERVALTKHVVKYVNGQFPVVSTGSFGTTLAEQVDCTRKIRDAGADAVILITSHLAAKDQSDDILIGNLEKFLRQTGDIPLGTYECPRPYKRLVTPKVLKFLMENKRWVYHKDTSEDISKIKTELAMLRDSNLEFYNAHTATALPSLQAGGAGLSPISANFYPEILSWICKYANDKSKATDLVWIQSEIAKMEPVISKSYNLSSKYFLHKRGMPIEVISRSVTKKIPAEIQANLDNAHKTFLNWCDRLSIQPVKA